MRPSRGLQQIRSGQTKRACRKAAGAAPSALLVGSHIRPTLRPPKAVLVVGHQLASVALAFFSVPIAVFTSAAIWWPWLEWWPKKVAASALKSRHLLIIAAKYMFSISSGMAF